MNGIPAFLKSLHVSTHTSSSCPLHASTSFPSTNSPSASPSDLSRSSSSFATSPTPQFGHSVMPSPNSAVHLGQIIYALTPPSAQSSQIGPCSPISYEPPRPSPAASLHPPPPSASRIETTPAPDTAPLFSP